MKPSTVTHISTVHPVFDTRIFYKECKSLTKYGINVNLIITHPRVEVFDKVRVIPLPIFKGRVARILIKPFLAFYKALKTRADLFHFHDPELIPIGILLKLCGKRVIYDAHEDVPAQILSKLWIPPHYRRFVSLAMKGVEALSSRFFDGIVAATPHITNIFFKRNYNSININNYPLTEEVSNFGEVATLNRKDEKSICYIGSITQIRGIFELLNAIEGTDIKLYLAGETSPKNLIKDLEKCKGWKNVVYFGQVDRKELSSILSKSQLGILLFHPLPNHTNCIPNKLFEYMSAGLPIVASNFPFWRDLLGDFDNVYFVDPLNPEEIRKAISILISDKEKWHSRGLQGIKAVKERYNWESEEKKLIDFYKNLGIRVAST